MGRKRRLDNNTIDRILDELELLYPDAGPELNYTNNFELLIATILSAQCTDIRVNIVTENLFKKYQSPEEFASLSKVVLGKEIKSCGLYQTKSQNIIETCKILVRDYDSIVPNNLDELVQLPGVGRKTANVVLSNGFNIPAIAVDTHVYRVSNRIGISNAGSVEKTEQQLMKRIKKNRWSKAHHLLIFHGRRKCKARKPECDDCTLSEECIYYNYDVKIKE